MNQFLGDLTLKQLLSGRLNFGTTRCGYMWEGIHCVLTSPSCSTWMCSFVCRALTLSGGNSTLHTKTPSALRSNGAVAAVSLWEEKGGL